MNPFALAVYNNAIGSRTRRVGDFPRLLTDFWAGTRAFINEIIG
jgi:hypothetical protein